MTPQQSPNTWQVPAHTVQELKEKQNSYCVCIPVINEGERILTQLKHMHELQIDRTTDIIIADGGSTDGSMGIQRLRTLGVRTVLTKTGPGKLSTQLRMGYAYAVQQGYKGVITVDGNGKDGVEAIPRFVQELESGVDFVQGSRFIRGGHAINTPLMRWVAIRFIHAPLLSLGAHFWYTDTTNGFRGYSSQLLEDKRVSPFRDIFSTYELLAYLSVRAPRLGYRVKEIPVTRAYPQSGGVPTKIHNVSGHMELLTIVLNAMRGRYDPSPQTTD